jgi:signal transduction histidine kinase/HAMP domain-containing protein
MTVRFRVLLFAGVAVALVALVGLCLFVLATRGRMSMENMLAIHQQALIYSRLSDDAQKYVHALLHAYESGQDTRPVLQHREKRAEEGFGHLEARIHQQPWRDRRGDLLLVEQLHQAYRNWLRFTEHRVREAMPGRQAVLLHDALDDYNKNVAPLLQVAWSMENDYLDTQVEEDLRSIRIAQRVAAGFPLVALVVMLALVLTLLLSLHRSLKDLHEAAERIGQGDFAHVLPVRAQDEHGEVAGAFNRMTAELRDTLREKERLAKAEAEASEREMRRYNALLEDTVHQRTAELARANAQLTQSLEQLQATQSQLLFSDRLATIGQLAAGVGHEINNPLAFILSNLSYAQQVLNETGFTPARPQGEEMAEALAEAREGAERVRVIVQDLKMLARPDTEASGPVDLAQVLRSAAKLAAHEVRHRAQLVESMDGVPPVKGCGARLCQVFLNLIINAAHAIEPGQVEHNRISLTARAVDSEHVVVEVSDTGCGIAPEHLGRIFDPFFTTKPAGVGSGLGLPVCQRIITAHGGSISVASEPGRGTTFRITLPRVPPRADC